MTDDVVDLWALDEVHFQQQGSRCRMWVPPETRDPVVYHQPTRKSVGYFAAVRLRDGEFLFRRESGRFNGESFWEFLKVFRAASAVAGRRVVAISDNAQYHRSKLHLEWRVQQVPDFGLDFLPPYSPELNPIERVWKLTRRLCLHNRYFAFLDSVVLPSKLNSRNGLNPMMLLGDYAQLLKTPRLESFLIPLILKWLLIGRFQPGEYELWGWYFCRWWIVRKAMEFSPLRFLAGSPLMPVYARLLGARVGRGCQIATAQLHLPDLVEIGEGASIGYDAEIQPFVIEGGRLRMAPVRIGAGAFIGSKAVILAGAEIGAGARIAEQTLIASGQKIPDRETWMGSPAQRTNSRDRLLEELEALGQAPARMSPSLWVAFVTIAV